MQQNHLEGQCLCGAVRFQLAPPIRDVIMCHCRQCARWTGYAVAAAAVRPENFILLSGEADLGWYRASEHAARGFCRNCGSSLFWKPDSGERFCVLAGAIEPPTGLTLAGHIFVADKSDYYTIDDGKPQFDQSGGDISRV